MFHLLPLTIGRPPRMPVHIFVIKQFTGPFRYMECPEEKQFPMPVIILISSPTIRPSSIVTAVMPQVVQGYFRGKRGTLAVNGRINLIQRHIPCPPVPSLWNVQAPSPCG